MTIRPGGEADLLLEEICAGQAGFAEMYQLPAFDTESDPSEQARLIAYLTDTVPACRSVSVPDQYLCYIHGYPAVLDNWTRSLNKNTMQNLEDLAKVAGQAQNGRYPEFGNLVPQLHPLARKLSIRLGLLPNLTNESWRVVQPILMDGIEPSCLDDLFSRKLLEGITPPSFGHQQRSNYFQRWLLSQRHAEASEECRILVRKLAGQMRDVSLATLPFGDALMAIATSMKELVTDELTEGLCEAGVSCFGMPIRGDALLRARNQWCDLQQSDVACLVATGLVNTGIHAKQEDDLGRRDALLAELRELAQAHPSEAAVREQLAKGLVNTGIHAKQEDDLGRRDALLAELRELAQAHPSEAVVRERLEVLITINDDRPGERGTDDGMSGVPIV